MSDTPNNTTSRPSGSEREFPCAKCGAKLVFAPGTSVLRCEYCGFENPIVPGGADGAGGGEGAPEPAPIEELDFEAALAEFESKQESEDRIVCRCGSCGAETALKPNVTSQSCAFCGTPIVAEGLSRKLIRPRSLLPFGITAQQSREMFLRWLGSLWFAPSDLKKFASVDGKLAGFYIPFWTYDARAVTRYTGERGDDYWETETYWTTVNGQRQMQTRQVRKTRWTPVSGIVRNRFDDVLVPASTSLPADRVEALGGATLESGSEAGWDLGNLVPYADQYLSGFQAESYTVDLRTGFGVAQGKMEERIRATVRADIGGDHQRIGSMEPRYSAVTFKHILLPIWIAAYRYAGKSYRFLVNARTGAVSGDRPYSWRKITLLVVGVLVVVGIIVAIAATR